MSTATETAGVETPPIADPKADLWLPSPTVLRGVRYRDYVALRDEPENGHLRMTYYDGTLEIMSPEFIHEHPSRRFGIFISVVCEELDIAMEGAGSTTFRKGEGRMKKGHGKEPDECFYFANALKIVGKEKLRLETDPPPDLWIEVDNRSSSKGKLPLYAALGVPEVWRFRAGTGRLWFGRLSADRSGYEKIDRSVCLPMLTPALGSEAMAMGRGVLESTWIKALRAWVREKLGNAGNPLDRK